MTIQYPMRRLDIPEGVPTVVYRPRAMKDAVGRWVRTRMDIETIGRNRIPSGAFCKIKRYTKGGSTLEYKCECCGSWVSIPKIPDSYFDFIAFFMEIPK